MDPKKHQISEVKTDVCLLLDCLKCQTDNPSAMKQALQTLATIFTTVASDEVKDYFRVKGGLDFIITLSGNVTNIEVKEAALFCLACAVENNVYSQKELTTISQFTGIHKILSDEKSTARLKHSASFLLLTLVSKNSSGQCLAKKTLCLSDLLTLLRTSLPSVENEDCWFDDAGTTGLELWSSVTATLCMCVNNPQNEENQRVCGFVLPYVFTIVQNHEDSIVKPLLSFIRFTVANNECNQNQVRRCGGLAVLSEKLGGCSGNHGIAIPIINTIDACITDNADNAEEIAQLETVKTMMGILDKTAPPHKLQIVLTLIHAVEMSDLNKKHVIEESGVFALMKSLNDIESGDDELFKAVKYLLQLCTKEEKSDEEAKETNEMLDILRRTEALHRNSGILLLNKINQLSDRIKQFEDESTRDSHCNQSTMSFMSEAMTFDPKGHQGHHDAREPCIPTSTPIIGRGLQTLNYVPRSLLTPRKQSHDQSYDHNKIVRTPSKNFDRGYQCYSGSFKAEQELLPQRLNNSYRDPVNVNINHHSNREPMIASPVRSRQDSAYDHNRNIKEAYLNDVELNRINPTFSAAGHLEAFDYSRYLVYDPVNKSFRAACGSDDRTSLMRRGDYSEMGTSSGVRGYDGVRKLTEIFDYDHQHHKVTQCSTGEKESSVTANQPEMESSQSHKGAAVSSSWRVDSYPSLCLKMTTGVTADLPQRGNSDPSLRVDSKPNDRLDRNSFDDIESEGMEHDLTKTGLDGSDTIVDRHQQGGWIDHVKGRKNYKPYVAEKLSKSKSTKSANAGPVSVSIDCESNTINNQSTFCENIVTIHSGPKKMESFDCNNNVVATSERDNEFSGSSCGKSFDANDSVFISGDAGESSKLASKMKKYEVKLIPVGDQRENMDMSFVKNLNKENKLQNVKESVLDNSCSKISHKNKVNEKTCVALETNHLKGNNEKSPNSSKDGQQSDCEIKGQLQKPKPFKMLEQCLTTTSKVRSTDVQTHSNKENLSTPNKDGQITLCTSSDKFKRPVGVPIGHSAKRSSVRRAEPFWRRHSSMYDSDSDGTSSCDEGSVFDEALIQTARHGGECGFSGRGNFDELSEHSVKPCTSLSSICSSLDTSVCSLSSSESSSHGKCAGCTSTHLNSRTYNIVLESDSFTCRHHRTIRDIERQFIKGHPIPVGPEVKKRPLCSSVNNEIRKRPFCPPPVRGSSVGSDVYEFSSDSDNGEITPPERTESFVLPKIIQSHRRKRVPFTAEEKQNLLLGVEKFGKSWSMILNNFNFHKTRTTVDLKDKYRGVQRPSKEAHNTKKSSRGKPFSMCEDRRLLRGIKQHGYNWKMILKRFTFSRERSSEDLRNRWRTIHKREGKA